MRILLVVAVLALPLTAVGAANGPTLLRASVDLSEWAPSQNLTLNLESGSYVVTPPVEGWPKWQPQPAERRGQLAGESLRMARALAEQAFEGGMIDKRCEARKGRDDISIIFTNAVGPTDLALTDGSGTQISAPSKCRSKAATALYDFVMHLFDHRSP